MSPGEKGKRQGMNLVQEPLARVQGGTGVMMDLLGRSNPLRLHLEV